MLYIPALGNGFGQPYSRQAGALTRIEFATALDNAGLAGVEITETHRVHEHAAAAIIRARKLD
jgi:hypothetical protein